MLFKESFSFYSHTKRTTAEETRDKELEIDRRCLSNLWTGYPKGKVEAMGVVKIDPRLLEHAFLEKRAGKCIEAYFQSAKCEDERAALFCFELEDPKDCAQFGRGHLPLTKTQRNGFKIQGMPLTEIDGITKKVIKYDPGASQRQGYIENSMKNICKNFEKLRESNPTGYDNTFAVYSPKMRNNWDEIKYELMFELVKAKFGHGGQATANDAARQLAIHNILHATEHADDTIWGDGKNGMGKNCLGKLISAVLRYMHIDGAGTDNLDALKWSDQLRRSMDVPAIKTVHYPDAPVTSASNPLRLAGEKSASSLPAPGNEWSHRIEPSR